MPYSPAGIASAAVNAAPMAGTFNFVQALAPGEVQSEVAIPLMLTQVNNGLVFTIPPDEPFSVSADEHYVIAPEYG